MNGKPVKNEELILVNGQFKRFFKTDSNGDYKVRVPVFMPDLSGYFWNGGYYSDKAIKDAYTYNDSMVRIESAKGGDTLLSNWKKYYFDTTYWGNNIQAHIDVANIILRDTSYLSSEHRVNIEHTKAELLSFKKPDCTLKNNDITRLQKYWKWMSEKHETPYQDEDLIILDEFRDTTEVYNPITEEIEYVYGYFQTTDIDTLLQVVSNLDDNFTQQLEVVDLHNRSIDSFFIPGNCTSLRIKQISDTIYHLYHNLNHNRWKEVLHVDRKGIIKSYYSEYESDN